MSTYIAKRWHRAHRLACAGVVRPHFQEITHSVTVDMGQNKRTNVLTVRITCDEDSNVIKQVTVKA